MSKSDFEYIDFEYESERPVLESTIEYNIVREAVQQLYSSISGNKYYHKYGEPCECGDNMLYAFSHKGYYNGSYSCMTLWLDCRTCGKYDVECV